MTDNVLKIYKMKEYYLLEVFMYKRNNEYFHYLKRLGLKHSKSNLYKYYSKDHISFDQFLTTCNLINKKIKSLKIFKFKEV